jgi:hypothetical protein
VLGTERAVGFGTGLNYQTYYTFVVISSVVIYVYKSYLQEYTLISSVSHSIRDFIENKNLGMG